MTKNKLGCIWDGLGWAEECTCPARVLNLKPDPGPSLGRARSCSPKTGPPGIDEAHAQHEFNIYNNIKRKKRKKNFL